MTPNLLYWSSSLLGLLTEAVLIVLLIKTIKHQRILRLRNRSLREEREVIFDFIHHVGELFADADDVGTDSLLKRILFFSTRTGRASSGAIYLFNRDRTRLFARAVSGIFPPLYDPEKVTDEDFLSQSKHLETLVKDRAIEAGEGIVGSAAAIGNGIIIEDAEMDARIPSYSNEFLKIRSLLAVPMRFGNEVLGALVLANRIDGTAFNPGDLSLLQAMADQASVPIHYAGLRAALEQKKQIDRDMQSARQIQKSLLPQSLPQLANVQMAAYNLPAFNIGGDYYDFIKIDEDHLGIAIADVSGKGIGGAMMMAVCQGVLRTRAAQETSPMRMLSELNRVLSANLAEDMFITMLYMVLNTRTGNLTFARAGHERPLLCRACDDVRGPKPLDAPGIAIGLADAEIFDSVIQDVSIQLHSGDGIIVYTDGITEALNEKNEEWGLDRLTDLVKTKHPENPDELMQIIRTALTGYVGARAQYDDMTLLCFKIN